MPVPCARELGKEKRAGLGKGDIGWLPGEVEGFLGLGVLGFEVEEEV